MAPDPRFGFEMTMIRMLAFRPVVGSASKKNLTGNQSITATNSSQEKQSGKVEDSQSQPGSLEEVQAKETLPIAPSDSNCSNETGALLRQSEIAPEHWQKIIDEMGRAGMIKEIDGRCSLKEQNENIEDLIQVPSQGHLLLTTQTD